ncbi:hypothetical protein [Roseivirga seohaensis]|uniref:hypothetical protein n=1 Tax=Roseivirga seohaensis TaxID=1914963 RepID=UPI001619B1B0|nr:hypothetical protein [Roseivirga seohaensis]
MAIVPDIAENNSSLSRKAGASPKAARKEESSPKAMITNTATKEYVPKLEINPKANLSTKLLKTNLPFSKTEERIKDPTKLEVSVTIKRLKMIIIKPKEELFTSTPKKYITEIMRKFKK